MFNANVFKFFTDIETALQCAAVNYALQLNTHDSVTFTRFHMLEINAKIKFTIHSDAASDLNVL